MKLKVFLVITLQYSALADIYLHNPRGSNNRLDENGRERNNANRLFDSQNNDRGGYNVGSLYYYGTSVLQIEWTNQHSCHDANSHCELIIQYMCGPNVRDGATTTTIPENRIICQDYNCNTDLQYGMHEDYSYYLTCKRRKRNAGLFTADQNMGGRNTARHTRQNPAGTRRGYECPEERDYYPYWNPSPWIDVVVMTNDASRCSYYKNESQNVKPRWACVVLTETLEKNDTILLPLTENECQAIQNAEWRKIEPHGRPAPDCRETEFTRDNHLGNGIGGQTNMYNWTVPDIDADSCTLRIRYNISTNDYNGWTTDSSKNADPRRLGDGTKVNLTEKYSFISDAAARSTGYVFRNDPQVKVFGDADFTLQLALDTTQYGRTFQDRSHTFAIKKRPSDAKGTIYNLNVRGKRGNIVQVYPGVEYDFVPNALELAQGDSIHIQWTGSNTNPPNNDGQGLAGTDRSNLVLLGPQRYPEGHGWAFGPGAKFGHFGVNYPMHLNNVTFLDRASMESLAFLNPGQFRGEMSELDDAGTYFDLGLRSVTSAVGIYHYMCTRNNNFSNRDQKGRITVNLHPVAYSSVGALGGTVALSDGSLSLEIAPGTFESLQRLSIQKWSTEEGEARLRAKNRQINVGEKYASHYYMVSPQEPGVVGGKTISARMSVTEDKDVSVYRTNADNFATWVEVKDVDVSNGVASFQVSEGGVFVARVKGANIGMIVGLVIMCIVIVAIVVGALVYFRRHPSKWQAVSTSCRNVKRSVHRKV